MQGLKQGTKPTCAASAYRNYSETFPNYTKCALKYTHPVQPCLRKINQRAYFAGSRSRSTSHGPFQGAYWRVMMLALTINVSLPKVTAEWVP